MITRFSCLSPTNAFTWYPESRINSITGKPGSGKTKFLTTLFTSVSPYPSMRVTAGSHYSTTISGKECVIRYESELQKWFTSTVVDPSVLYATDNNSYLMLGKKLYRNEPSVLVPFSVPAYQIPSFLTLLGHPLPKLTGKYDTLPAVLHRYTCLCFYLQQYRPKTLLLDTPELHVHRSRLRYLPQLLSHIADYFGTQIITTTGTKLLVAGNNTKNWVLSKEPPFITEAYWRP